MRERCTKRTLVKLFVWARYLLEVEQGDVFVVFVVRRYENSTLRLAEMAAERGAKIILFTDQWASHPLNLVRI